ncbi:MAG: hypothetical protein A3I77_05205 [Gammaproteobacteria bacterium RIFCSPLOWO2_02_FULL_42_14]|nr:MAG: hypothetical protein A3B71_01770 [Gammaproteobacteria bacterium RIFCSPHIGHO2_02_FULL_42_43]OGT29168.1 MAG: hypothetical protein A2624_01910 [Gammaproteobacteria bacterium RIFCSPHIGHO2_01_FULL_42_8]OGT51175.1 MAG: hypothetical protein A3E54_02960 [Gammaproteobacteria bacterium RIFCSPHIGHO2_12_FULL_41_25]OGT62937.1 MAG: hypothetical protein A3I77_05205 [Gammaproteobacteria bacterium RIFCSPLOWO2_02_FULL_42_14]OGT86069.1 MAG: hypothetical protein A3G86_02760 [Gammaproteobacteria bacterium R
MTFLNLTVDPPVERELSLMQVQSIIKAGTGRDLVFEDLQFTRFSLLKLVRFPDPIGFAIVANQDIKSGTVLCPYGGEITSQPASPAPCTDIDYLLTAIDKNETYQQQARNSGDLGALFAHLPDKEFLEHIGLDTKDYPKIQMANTTNILCPVNSGNYRFYMQSTCEIKKGTVIGFSYGWEYWAEKMISPVFFVNSTTEIFDMAQAQFTGRAIPYDSNKDIQKTMIGRENKLNSYSLFLFAQILSSYPAEAKTIILKHGLELERAAFFATTLRAACANPDVRTLKDLRLKQVMVFFPITQQSKGCEPPEDSYITKEGVTKVPKIH